VPIFCFLLPHTTERHICLHAQICVKTLARFIDLLHCVQRADLPNKTTIAFFRWGIAVVGIVLVALDWWLHPYDLTDLRQWGFSAAFLSVLYYFWHRLAGKSIPVLGMYLDDTSSESDKFYTDVLAFLFAIALLYCMFSHN
jgi:hypothetical protein